MPATRPAKGKVKMTVKELRDILDKLDKNCDDLVVVRPKPQWRPGPGFGYDEHYKGDEYMGEEDRPIRSASVTWSDTFRID